LTRITKLFTDDMIEPPQPRAASKSWKETDAPDYATVSRVSETDGISSFTEDRGGMEDEQETDPSSLKGFRHHRPRICMRISKVFGSSSVEALGAVVPLEILECMGMVEAEKCTYICESTVVAKPRQAEMIDPFMRALPGGVIIPSYFALDTF
jgi:hypothetical protein